jgi:SH3-like domain-containing protein
MKSIDCGLAFLESAGSLVKRDIRRLVGGALAAGFIAVASLGGAPVALAQTSIGPETRLPLPRYVSLKTDRVNMREGPSTDHGTRWVYQRAGLPVEIIAEFDNWRRIRDPEGEDGWVWHSLLSGRRTAIIAPWDREMERTIDLLEQPEPASRVVARVQPGVVAGVSRCSGDWCRLAVSAGPRREIIGFVRQEELWGVYPDETLD